MGISMRKSFLLLFVAAILMQGCFGYAKKSDVIAVKTSLDYDIEFLQKQISFLAFEVDSLTTKGFTVYVVKQGKEDLELISEEVFGDSSKWILIEYWNYDKLMREGLHSGMKLIIWR